MRSNRKLPKEIIEQYKEDGAVLLKGVFDKQWIDLIDEGISSVQAKPSPFGQSLADNDGGGVYFNDYFNWRNVPQFSRLVNESPAAHIAGQLMGSRLSIFYHEHVLTKAPGTAKATPWHHDQSYYPIDGDQIVSLWIPVDYVGLDAAIQFVKGSHSWNRWFRPKMFATEENYEEMLDDPDKNEPSGIKRAHVRETHNFEDVPTDSIESGMFGCPLSWAVEPGDAIAFHGRTIHGAPGNLSTQRHRRILSLRWLGEEAVIAHRPWKPSPPMELHAGLNPGDKLLLDKSGTFPIIWSET